MPSYEAFARFYDAVQGDRSEALPFVRPHLAGAASVLELACGTGSILAHLRSEFEVVGVDLSPEMLEVAREKVPGVELVLADMTSVRLGRTFDAVLCLYDAVNHLLEWEQWESLFDTAAVHLQPGGVFVFDVNDEERLDWFVGRPAIALDFDGDNVATIDVVDGGGRIRNWELRFFEHVEGDAYRMSREVIHEVAFPEAQIRAALDRRFAHIEVEDDNRRLWFACRGPSRAADT
jgi:SAM-dependent methyltransferase